MIKVVLPQLLVALAVGALSAPVAPARHKRGFASGYDTISHSHDDVYTGPALIASEPDIDLPYTRASASLQGSYGVHDHQHLDSAAVIRSITIHKDISVPVPQPYPVPVERPVPVPVKVPVNVPVDKPFPVPVDKPYPVYINRPVPVKVFRDIPVEVPVSVPVPVQVPVAVPVPRPVPVPHPVPHYVHIHKAFPVKLIIKEHREKGWWG